MDDLPLALRSLTTKQEGLPRLIARWHEGDLTTERHDNPPLEQSITGVGWLNDHHLFLWRQQKPEVIALDASTGETLWRFDSSVRWIRSVLHIFGRGLLAVVGNDRVLVLDTEWGSVVFSVDAPIRQCVVSPDGEVLFVSSHQRKRELSAYRIPDGALLWSREIPGNCTIAWVSGNLLIKTREIQLIHPQTGELVQTQSFRESTPGTLLDIVALDGDQWLEAYNYDQTEGDGHREVYDTLLCYDINEQSRRWSFEPHRYVRGSLSSRPPEFWYGTNHCVKQWGYSRKMSTFEILSERAELIRCQVADGKRLGGFFLEDRQIEASALSPGRQWWALVTNHNEVLVFIFEEA
jgi:hypothetical protein